MTDFAEKPVQRHKLYRILRRQRGIDPALSAAFAAGSAPDDASSILNCDDLDEALRDFSAETRKLALDSFASDIEKCRTGMRRSVEFGDLKDLERHSHMLKSVAGTFGARKLQEVAREINTSCRRGTHARAAKLLPDVEHATDQTLIELSALASTERW